mgnify:CR=1 FL=1
MFTYKGKTYDTSHDSIVTRHGGPFDRGSADSYYSRGFTPHFYCGATGTSTRIEEADMSPMELEQYAAGYAYNEEMGYKKEW